MPRLPQNAYSPGNIRSRVLGLGSQWQGTHRRHGSEEARDRVGFLDVDPRAEPS